MPYYNRFQLEVMFGYGLIGAIISLFLLTLASGSSFYVWSSIYIGLLSSVTFIGIFLVFFVFILMALLPRKSLNILDDEEDLTDNKVLTFRKNSALIALSILPTLLIIFYIFYTFGLFTF